MTSKLPRVLCALMLSVLLPACGQKGPLTLPDHKSHKVTPATTPQPAAPAPPDSGSASASSSVGAAAAETDQEKKKQDESQH